MIDEFLGTWIPMFAAAVTGEPVLTAILAVIGFAAFRVIDIVKTPLARKLELVGGGWGVVLDDALAGLYALLIVVALRFMIV